LRARAEAQGRLEEEKQRGDELAAHMEEAKLVQAIAIKDMQLEIVELKTEMDKKEQVCDDLRWKQS
jgi:hypothetical protein